MRSGCPESVADQPKSPCPGTVALDPKETCRPYLTNAQLVDRSNTAPAIDGGQRCLPMCFGTGPCRAWTEAITKPRSCNFTDQSLTKALRASTGHSSFDLREHRGSRRPARSTKTGIRGEFCCLRITERRCDFREKSLSSRQYCTARKWRKRRTLPASSWGAALREGARGPLVFEATRLAISRILCRRSPRSFGTLGASDGSRSFPGVLPFAGKSDDRSKGAGRRRNPTGTGLERRMIGVAAV